MRACVGRCSGESAAGGAPCRAAPAPADATHLRGPTRYDLSALLDLAYCDMPALADPHPQTGANPAWVDLVHSAGSLLPPRLRDAIAGFTFTCLPMQLHAVRGVDSICVASVALGGAGHACPFKCMQCNGEHHMVVLFWRAAAAATAASRSAQPPPLLHAPPCRSRWPCLPPSSRPLAASLRPASSAGEAPPACTCCLHLLCVLCAFQLQPAVPFACTKPSRCHECRSQILPLICCFPQAPLMPAPLTLHALPHIPAPLTLQCSPCALPLQLQDQRLWRLHPRPRRRHRPL